MLKIIIILLLSSVCLIYEPAYALSNYQNIHPATNRASFSAPKDCSTLSDNEIKNRLVQSSKQSYQGNCPCPDDRDRLGRICGQRSAYSKVGGQSPLCFPTDITSEMIQIYRKNCSRI